VGPNNNNASITLNRWWWFGSAGDTVGRTNKLMPGPVGTQIDDSQQMNKHSWHINSHPSQLSLAMLLL